MNWYKIVIEFLIIFGIISILYYFVVIKKCKKNNQYVPAEVNLILLLHKIDVKKINLYQMIKVVCLSTSLILSLIITVISELYNNTIISLIFGTLLSIAVALIIYRIIGNYYENISRKKNIKKK